LGSEEKQLKAMGVLSFLAKPFTVNQLVSEIDQVVNVIRNAQGKSEVGSPGH
jgi:hypothetical protein